MNWFCRIELFVLTDVRNSVLQWQQCIMCNRAPLSAWDYFPFNMLHRLTLVRSSHSYRSLHLPSSLKITTNLAIAFSRADQTRSLR